MHDDPYCAYYDKAQGRVYSEQLQATDMVSGANSFYTMHGMHRQGHYSATEVSGGMGPSGTYGTICRSEWNFENNQKRKRDAAYRKIVCDG